MSTPNDDVIRALEKVASDNIRNSVQGTYNELGSVMKEVGAPSNNMLLSYVHGESKRTADEVSRLNTKMSQLEQRLATLHECMERLCDLTETQNVLLSSQRLQESASTPEPALLSRRQTVQTGQGSWFYQGNKLTSKYRMIACIISQFVDIVKLKMELQGTYYPDSVDANFTVLEYCVREVSKVRCSIPLVKFKPEIDIPDIKSPSVYDRLLPLIASKSEDTSTTLTETRLYELSMPVSRSIMEAVSRVCERLRYLEGILSSQQIDILKSIGFPIIKVGTESEFNWNKQIIVPRGSHPVSRSISDLPPTGKAKYIQFMMKNQSMMQSFTSARDPSVK